MCKGPSTARSSRNATLRASRRAVFASQCASSRDFGENLVRVIKDCQMSVTVELVRCAAGEPLGRCAGRIDGCVFVLRAMPEENRNRNVLKLESPRLADECREFLKDSPASSTHRFDDVV